MKDLERFVAGFRSFQQDYFGPSPDGSASGSPYEILRHGQSPKTMVIACADSRVDPAILMNTAPGDVFTVRNVANLVPPRKEHTGHHAVSAALEYASCALKVEHIIVLGHSTCGGIAGLMSGNTCPCAEGGGYLSRWVSVAEPARQRVLAELGHKDAELQQRAVEQAAILLSLENLRTFPFIEQRILEGTLSLHGWYFDIQAGELHCYDTSRKCFVPAVPAQV